MAKVKSRGGATGSRWYTKAGNHVGRRLRTLSTVDSYLLPVTCHLLPVTCYALKLLPQPHPPVAFGLLNVKPDPCIELT